MLQNYENNRRIHCDFLSVLDMPSLTTGHDWIIDDQWLSEFRQHAVIPNDVKYSGNRRLGFYYQWLWQQLIIHHPHYSLIGEEIQLEWQNQTLGAIDFLVHNHLSDEVEHWEVAIKFYLAFNHSWPGPNANDNLDKKINRMINHQLKLTTHPAFLQSHKAIPTKHRLIMQGRLFHAWPSPQSGSNIAVNPDAFSGNWCYCSEANDLKLKPLTKSEWITPPKFSSLQQTLNLNDIKVPTQAVDKKDNIWFIVPNIWPSKK